jgi:hypothetical protein
MKYILEYQIIKLIYTKQNGSLDRLNDILLRFLVL